MADDSGLYVQGIEVTQAIQYYRSEMHLTDPLDRARDNAARLVANKPAWVRVYVRSSAESIQNVTGSLRVERYNPEEFLAELTPQPPGTVTAYPEPGPGPGPFFTPYTFYRWERSTPSMTLNFVIPADQMCGYLRLTARVSAPDGQTHEMTALLDVTLHQHIHFRAFMIGYKGKDPLDPSGTKQKTVDPPTMSDLQATSMLTLLMYPVSSTATTYESAGTLTVTAPLGSDLCKDPNLMKMLDQAAFEDGDQLGCIYYGLIAPTVPGATGGCSDGSNVATGCVESPEQLGAERVMAHEIGHLFHPGHAPCGLPSSDANDPNYPNYEPYDPASIGEFGLDINSGDVMPPDNYTDIMTYCPPNQWISLYGHRLRIKHPLLNPQTVCFPTVGRIEMYYPPKIPIDVTFPFVQAKPRPLIAIYGTQDLMGKVTIEGVFRSVSYGQPRGVPTPLIAVLEGADRQPLATAPMFRLSAERMGSSGCCGDDDRAPFSIKALLPDVAPGTALRVLKDGEETWHRHAPSAHPHVTELSAEVRQDSLAVNWRAEASGPDQPEYWVRWSGDGGETWNGLGVGITEAEAEFPLEGLPTGEIHLQVVVHDGFFSVASEPIAVRVPDRPPIITILHPREGTTIPAGSALHLWAAVTSVGQEIEPDDFRWLVNDEEVGRGLEAWTVAPDAGEHACMLKGEHAQIQRGMRFTTEAPPHPRHGPRSS